MEIHEYFRLDETAAFQIVKKVKNAVQQWKRVAQKYGISKTEKEIKALAFSQAK